MGWTADITAGLIVNLVGLALTGSTILYRIKQLEKKVEKHNSFMERVAALEHDMKNQQCQINDIKLRKG